METGRRVRCGGLVRMKWAGLTEGHGEDTGVWFSFSSVSSHMGSLAH